MLAAGQGFSITSLFSFWLVVALNMETVLVVLHGASPKGGDGFAQNKAATTMRSVATPAMSFAFVLSLINLIVYGVLHFYRRARWISCHAVEVKVNTRPRRYCCICERCR